MTADVVACLLWSIGVTLVFCQGECHRQSALAPACVAANYEYFALPHNQGSVPV
jgi:hypothetical protein